MIYLNIFFVLLSGSLTLIAYEMNEPIVAAINLFAFALNSFAVIVKLYGPDTTSDSGQ